MAERCVASRIAGVGVAGYLTIFLVSSSAPVVEAASVSLPVPSLSCWRR